MKQPISTPFYCLLLVLLIAPQTVLAHHGQGVHTHHDAEVTLAAPTQMQPILIAQANRGQAGAGTKSNPKVSGQGTYKFKVLYTKTHLPPKAVEVLEKAHGAFGVDRRKNRGEVYFALRDAGIIQISSDLKKTQLLPTPPELNAVNAHAATVWTHADGTPYLSFPSDSGSIVITTTLKGKLVHTLTAPTAADDFDQTTVNAYFRDGGRFVPTGVEHLDGLFYITTGYSKLDYILTAKIVDTKPFTVKWNDLAFGGKGDEPGQFGVGHHIIVPIGTKRLDISDRPNAEVERYTRYGNYRGTLPLIKGSYPCSIDYEGGYAVVACLYGPDRSKGAPLYLLEGDNTVSTIMLKGDLGLETFQHLHGAAIRIIGGKIYLIAQSWNPGDFVILEQVVP
jgi:hypothetical protein